MFESLTEKLENAINKIKGYGTITEDNISDAMREVRLALLEADVNYKVVKEFTNKVKEKALGEEVKKSLKPGDVFLKILKDELLELLGVKMIVIPCNTCCYFHDKLQSETSITIRNMVRDTVEYIKNKKYKKVCVMATLGTIESKLYQNELDKYNIEYVIADTTKTMDIIYNYVKANKKVDKKQFDNIISDVKADAYILGCTELSVLKKELKLEDKFIDPLEVEVSIVLKYFNKERK